MARARRQVSSEVQRNAASKNAKRKNRERIAEALERLVEEVAAIRKAVERTKSRGNTSRRLHAS
jgi:hypothetical protein